MLFMDIKYNLYGEPFPEFVIGAFLLILDCMVFMTWKYVSILFSENLILIYYVVPYSKFKVNNRFKRNSRKNIRYLHSLIDLI